ncbi:O-antigen polymerase [Pseudoduganella ginsengisoli]|uniref:Oligosaccharide repeat unit polymerase n=1 Tax=Pseudoduganella ginsengisoli TaxID=1462440 RepID=A0A6L6PTB5_9BURK|nr:oligosaccharide repeat unit polymerase [Pseudoduganella ginsengisoli]MTW00519.1 oligosaccharide repeat unit polymerase [Pseudoduganella ginsengisoli]
MMLIFGAILLIITCTLYISYEKRLTPGLCLVGSWSFVCVTQGIFAADMYFSWFGGVIVLVFCSAFIVGEYFGLSGLQHVRINTLAELSARDLILSQKFRKNLLIVVLIVGLYSLVAMVDYYQLLKGYSTGEEESIIISGVREVLAGDGIPLPMFIKVGITMAYAGVILALVYWILFGWRWFLILPIISVVLFGFSQSGRAGTIIILLQSFSAMYFRDLYNGKRNAAQRLGYRTMALLAVAFLIFVGGQILREGGEGKVEDVFRIFLHLRGYMFGGVSAFSHYVDYWMVDAQVSWGRYTFSSLYQALGLYAQETGIYDQYAPISQLGEVSNIYTAFRSLIDDFHLIGGAIFCLLFGYGSGRLFSRSLHGDVQYFGPLIGVYSWAFFAPMASLTYFNSFLVAMFFPWLYILYLLQGEGKRIVKL